MLEIEKVKLDNLIVRDFMIKVSHSVDDAIQNQLFQEEYDQIREMVSYQHTTGGKRLRPALSVLTGMAYGADYQKVIDISTLCEIMHTATLCIDDVVDWDRTRRGEPTVMDLFGVGEAIMSGMLNAILSFEIALKEDPRLAFLAIDTLKRLSIGNAEELQRVNALDEDQYIRVIELKTSSLFSAATQLGTMLTDTEPETTEQAKQFGKELGVLYQLCDDVVDVQKSIKLKKPIGDLKLGVVTLPLIYTYRMTSDKKMKAFIKKYVKEPDVGPEKVMAILEEIEKLDAVQYVLNEIEDRADAARAVIKDWPDNEHTEMLRFMPEFMAQSLLIEIDKEAER